MSIQSRPQKAKTQGHYVKVFTIFVDSEGDVGGHDLVVADLAVLEGAVSIHSLHSQDAVVLLSLNNGGFVGFLLEHWWVLVDVIHLDVDGRPDRHPTIRMKAFFTTANCSISFGFG